MKVWEVIKNIWAIFGVIIDLAFFYDFLTSKGVLAFLSTQIGTIANLIYNIIIILVLISLVVISFWFGYRYRTKIRGKIKGTPQIESLTRLGKCESMDKIQLGGYEIGLAGCSYQKVWVNIRNVVWTPAL